MRTITFGWLIIHFKCLHARYFACIYVYLNFLKKLLRVSNSLDSGQALYFIWPDLCPNCLRSLSADNTGRQRVKEFPIGISKLSGVSASEEYMNLS